MRAGGSRPARPDRKSLAPSWWTARAVRPGAPAVLSAVAKRVPAAEGTWAPRWRHGPSHSRPWGEWSRTSQRSLPQRPLQRRRARPTRRPTNASSGRTRARSIVAGRPIARLAALHRRCWADPWMTGGRESDKPSRTDVRGHRAGSDWVVICRRSERPETATVHVQPMHCPGGPQRARTSSPFRVMGSSKRDGALVERVGPGWRRRRRTHRDRGVQMRSVRRRAGGRTWCRSERTASR